MRKEGHVERTAMMERQHQRIMEKINEQMVHDAEVQRTGGQYNNVNMMHQYGAGNQDLLLMSNQRRRARFLDGREVSGQCAGALAYDVSAINVEITLNMWLDFYPGYMYVLTENIDKVRAEETKNKEARDVEGYNPGGVMNGLQNQWIQPLVLRGNQGDCVKLTLRNQLEGRGRGQSQHSRFQHGYGGHGTAGLDHQSRQHRRPRAKPWRWNGTSRRLNRRVAASSIPTAMIAS
jgi:hypothetical protein